MIAALNFVATSNFVLAKAAREVARFFPTFLFLESAQSPTLVRQINSLTRWLAQVTWLHWGPGETFGQISGFLKANDCRNSTAASIPQFERHPMILQATWP